MRQSTNESGFSLIELVVAVAILLVIMSAAFQLMTRSQTSFDANQILAEAHENADFAVSRVTEIVRGAGCNPTGQPTINATRLSTSNANQAVTIISDLDGDGSTSSHVEEAAGATHFIISSENLTLQFNSTAKTIDMVDHTQSNTTVPIAEHITAFEVELFNDPEFYVGGGSREARITVTAGPTRNLDANDARYREFTTVTEVRLRNF